MVVITLSALSASLRLHLGACTSCDAETLGSCASEAGGGSHESGADPWVLVTSKGLQGEGFDVFCSVIFDFCIRSLRSIVLPQTGNPKAASSTVLSYEFYFHDHRSFVSSFVSNLNVRRGGQL